MWPYIEEFLNFSFPFPKCNLSFFNIFVWLSSSHFGVQKQNECVETEIFSGQKTGITWSTTGITWSTTKNRDNLINLKLRFFWVSKSPRFQQKKRDELLLLCYPNFQYTRILHLNIKRIFCCMIPKKKMTSGVGNRIVCACRDVGAFFFFWCVLFSRLFPLFFLEFLKRCHFAFCDLYYESYCE